MSHAVGRFRSAGVTDRGRVRELNEDAFLTFDSGLLVVADGMGGHHGGRVAAQHIVARLPELAKQRLRHAPDALEAVRAVLLELSDEVRGIGSADATLRGLGAAVVLVHVRGADAYVANMGDARAYLFRDSVLRQMTTDHSVVAMLLRR